MDLEYECFSVPESENTPHIKHIIEEFKEKQTNETEKHRQLSLYTKKEYFKSINEQRDTILRDIELLKEWI